MTTELEKHKLERIYKHFGFTGENIQSQKQVLKDIHDILIELGASKAQSPDCVAISTKNNTHKIVIIKRGRENKYCVIPITSDWELFFISIVE